MEIASKGKGKFNRKSKQRVQLERKGLLLYKDRLYIPNVPKIKLLILNEFHKTPYSGHLGYQKTITMLRKDYFWPNMKNELVEYITTTFRPKIRRQYCRIFDTFLSHVRHYDFFLSVGGVSSVIRHLTSLSVKRHRSLPSVICKRRLSDMKNRQLSNRDKEEVSVKRHKEPWVKRRR